MNIYEFWNKESGKFAIIEKDRRVTFKQLDRLVSIAAYILKDKYKIEKEDIIVVYEPMSINLYIILLAIFKIGAVAMFIEPSFGRKLIGSRNIGKPKAIIAKPLVLAFLFFNKYFRNIPIKISSNFLASMDGRSNKLLKETEVLDQEHPALITFTSGSSGIPKGILRTHGFLLSQHKAIESSMSKLENGFDLISLPIFLLSNIGSNITSVIPDSNLRKPANVDIANISNQIEDLKIKRVTLPPVIFEKLFKYATAKKIIYKNVTQIYTGGGPVFPRLFKGLNHIFPNASISSIYGSTEAEPIAKINFADLKQKDFKNMEKGAGLIAGNIVSDINLKIVNLPDDFKEVSIDPLDLEFFSAKQGKIGEILVAGDNVVKSYMDMVKNIGTKFQVEDEVWHRTGDAGYIDKEGRLVLVGRYNQIINKGSKLICPFSIECAVNSIEDVKESALLKARNNIVIFVEVVPYADKKAIIVEIKEKFPDIDKVKFLSKIPKDKRHNSKIDYKALIALSTKL